LSERVRSLWVLMFHRMQACPSFLEQECEIAKSGLVCFRQKILLICKKKVALEDKIDRLNFDNKLEGGSLRLTEQLRPQRG
jgi:hypothetical protein